MSYNLFQVETALTVFNNLIQPFKFDTTTLNSKARLLASLDSLSASMCKGFVVGQAAGVATSDPVTIVTINKNFGDVDTAIIKLGAADSFSSSSVVLGSTIKRDFALYTCGTGGASQCTSACVSSWEVSNSFSY